MIKFPSIEQFRSVVKHVQLQTWYTGKDAGGNPSYDKTREMPVLKFRGTVKLHGTNAAVVIYNDRVEYQSRSRVLSIGSDNSGFMLNMSKYEELFKEIAEDYSMHVDVESVAIFGEWCGSGIQSGVGVSSVPRMFVAFAIKITDTKGESWWDNEFIFCNEEARIFSIGQFPTWEIDIDFAFPEKAQNEMIELMEKVESECPVAKYFGVSGIGEGIVFSVAEPNQRYGYSGTIFKVKGEKHSTSKVKTLNVVDIEAIENLNALVESVVTEARLEWALDNLVREQLKPVDMKSMGDFIRTVYNDVIKEELDVIQASGFEVKKLGGPIANKARPWYTRRINNV